MRFDLNNKVFRSVTNSPNGQVSDNTRFYYQQQGKLVFANYKGGEILFGQLLGFIDPDNHLEIRYQHFDVNHEFRTGICQTKVERLEDDRFRLLEKWQWTNGDKSKGESILEEIPKGL